MNESSDKQITSQVVTVVVLIHHQPPAQINTLSKYNTKNQLRLWGKKKILEIIANCNSQQWHFRISNGKHNHHHILPSLQHLYTCGFFFFFPLCYKGHPPSPGEVRVCSSTPEAKVGPPPPSIFLNTLRVGHEKVFQRFLLPVPGPPCLLQKLREP